MKETELLEKYLVEGEPKVNYELRNGLVSELTFDGLFEEGDVPEILYRLVPNENIHFHDDAFCDPGYLSCTTKIENFIGHVQGDHVAILKLRLQSPVSRIVVNDLLTDATDEGEYILPRNMNLHLAELRVYQQEEFDQLLESENCMISSEELIHTLKIAEITVYELSQQIS